MFVCVRVCMYMRLNERGKWGAPRVVRPPFTIHHTPAPASPQINNAPRGTQVQHVEAAAPVPVQGLREVWERLGVVLLEGAHGGPVDVLDQLCFVFVFGWMCVCVCVYVGWW